MSTPLYYLVISVIQVTLGAGPMCFECTDIPSPQTCQYVTQCGEHEHCSVESVVTSGGLALFNVGCRPKTQCVDIKRNLFSIQDDTSTDLITCLECCTNGDFCNREGCGKMDVPRNRRGPYCYTCDVQSNTTTCRKATLCGPDDVCVLEPNHKFPPYIFYTSRCSQESNCQASGTHDHSSNCSVCCDSDFCNNHCNHSNIYIDPAVTTRSASTLWETASSRKTTPTVIKHPATTTTTPTKSTNTGAPDRACQGVDYIQTTLTHLCIRIHRQAINFTDAESQCQSEHAHLVRIDSLLKAIDVARNLPHSHQHRYYWIGLADIHHNKSLYWLNGELLAYSNFRQQTLDTRQLGTGFAIVLDSLDARNGWTVTNAQNVFGFICEKSLATSVPLNKSINEVCNGAEGFHMDSNWRVCVKMVKDIKLTWLDAVTYCKNIRSTMLELSFQLKQQAVMEIVGDNDLLYDFWLSLHAQNGTWYWWPFRDVKWSHWQPGHPAAYLESHACAAIWHWEWFSTSCNDTRHFICERHVLW